MPDTFESATRKFEFGGFSFYATAAASKDRKSGFLQINGIPKGDPLAEAVGGAMKDWAETFTVAWKHGAPLGLLIEINSRNRWGYSGPTGDPDLGFATSPADPVVRWMGQVFLGAHRPSLAPSAETVPDA
jgi:hypothetical protein